MGVVRARGAGLPPRGGSSFNIGARRLLTPWLRWASALSDRAGGRPRHCGPAAVGTDNLTRGDAVVVNLPVCGGSSAKPSRTTMRRAAQVLVSSNDERSAPLMPLPTDEELLDELRLLLARRGKRTMSLIEASECTRSPNTYIRRFGSLTAAYERIAKIAFTGDPAYACMIHPGVNARGQPVPAPVDGFAVLADDPSNFLLVAHTTMALRALRTKVVGPRGG